MAATLVMNEYQDVAEELSDEQLRKTFSKTFRISRYYVSSESDYNKDCTFGRVK